MLNTFLTALVLAPVALHAHPGHSLQDAGLSHLITSPDHLVVLGALGAALVLGGQLLRQRIPRAVLRGCGALALIGAAALWGMGA